MSTFGAFLIYLFFDEHLSYEDIAEITGLSVEVVEQLIDENLPF